jgi:hypothetical protein
MENMLIPVSSAELIASSHDAIDAIKTAAGLSSAQFAALCMPLLRAYADQVQHLPLSTAAFGSPRGAWEFGMSAAMVAYRYAGTVIFYPTLGAEERRLLEPQCRYMAFVATLATAIATLAESCILTAGEDEYHPLCVDGTLYTWLVDHPGARFSWRVPVAPLSSEVGAAIAANFVPKRVLANFDLRAILMMYEAISPKKTLNGVESTLARVVRDSVQVVIEHYKSKEAGTFKPGAGGARVSAEESDNLAGKLIAVANPTILANPLEAQAAAPVAKQLALASADAQTPKTPAAPIPHGAVIAQSPEAPEQSAAATATVAGQPMTGAANDAEEKLARGHKVLREWFSALKQHPQFHVLKDQLVMNSAGIEVPVSMLGMFGVSGATVRKMMDDAGLILGRSSNARGVILHPGLSDRFINQ